jgi:hypothetical protein
MALDAGQELWPPEEAVQGTSKSHGDSLLGGETWGGQKVKCLICESFYQTQITLSTIFVATHRSQHDVRVLFPSDEAKRPGAVMKFHASLGLYLKVDMPSILC